MDHQKRNIISIVLKRSLFFLFILGALYALSQLFAYISSGADLKDALQLEHNIRGKHHPLVTWNNSAAVEESIPDPYTIKQIQEDYLEAWYILNQSIRKQNGNGLEDFFSDSLVLQIKDLYSNDGFYHEQVELSHHIDVHLYSYDKQLIAFRDLGIRQIQKVSNAQNKIIHQWETIINYEIVMHLEDGQWKIIALKKVKPDEHTPSTMSSPTLEAPQIDIAQFQGINYYSKANPWLKFWTHFEEEVIRTDLDQIKDLGFNSVRIFLPSDGVVEHLEFQTMLKRLSLFLDLAHQKNLKVMVCLFDFPVSYHLDYYPKTQIQLIEIVETVKNHPALLLWDLKNEADRDFESHGQEIVLKWLEFCLKTIKDRDPNHPTTVGWSQWKFAHHLSEQLEVISFHDYEDPATLQQHIQDIKKATPNSPILLSEYGKSTYRGVFAPFGASAEKQQAYLEECKTILQNEKVGGMIWTLHDFEETPTEVFGLKPWIKAKQRHFGIKK